MHSIKPEVRQALADLVRRECGHKILEIARLLHENCRIGTTRDSPDLVIRQMVNGFVAVMLEGLAGEGGEARPIFFETLITSLRAAGSPSYDLVQWNGTFVTLLAAELVPLLPAEVRGEGASWFASFAGTYLGDLMQTALSVADRLSANP